MVVGMLSKFWRLFVNGSLMHLRNELSLQVCLCESLSSVFYRTPLFLCVNEKGVAQIVQGLPLMAILQCVEMVVKF